MKNSLFIKEG